MSTIVDLFVAAKFGSFLLWMIAICTYNHKIAKKKLLAGYTLHILLRNWN
jgi:hypothetical protein